MHYTRNAVSMNAELGFVHSYPESHILVQVSLQRQDLAMSLWLSLIFCNCFVGVWSKHVLTLPLSEVKPEKGNRDLRPEYA